MKKKTIKKTSNKKKVSKITNIKKISKSSIKKKFEGKSVGQIALIALLMFLIIILFVGIIFSLYIIFNAPPFSADQLYNKEATILYDINGNEYATLGSENREIVTYDDLPQVLVDAIVATEDSRYFQHNGFDIARFLKASAGQVINKFIGGGNAGGASTLTMQVVKNTFTGTQSNGIEGIIRKFTDIYMSVFKLEKKYTKEEIIEFYVNAPYLGNYSYGVETASQAYFGKSVSDLTLPEAALIAGLFQAPDAYNPFNNQERCEKRRSTVLYLMYKHGYITKEEKELAEKISVKSLLIDQEKTNKNEYQAFVDTVVEEVKKRTEKNPYDVPMLIYTTMDPSKQQYINTIMDGTNYKFINDVVQMGIMVTNVKDGSITAVGAGRNRKDLSEWNYATQISRHPGSAAKPFFAYGPNIEYNNASPATYFFDYPYKYSNGRSIKNAEGGYRGMMSMKTALSTSRNIPALQSFQSVDNAKIAEFVHNLGFDYGTDLFESSSVGAFDGTNPKTMSAAYATLARGGEYIEPYSFTKIIYRDTKKEYKPDIDKKQVMSDSTAFMLTYILNYAIENNKILGSLKVGSTEVAGKTGTSTIDSSKTKALGIPSSAIRDSWANMYTSDYSISLWYGYKLESKEYYLTINPASKVRKEVSQLLAKNILNTGAKFSVPKSVVKAKYELETVPLMKPSDNTPEDLIGTEYFKKGTEPTETSWRFETLANPTNLKASYDSTNITISWDAIASPKAIDNSFLQEYFNKNYLAKQADFYQTRLNYNSSYIGSIGYQVYLVDEAGNTTDLGFTTSNSLVYTPMSTGKLSFIVKSSYSIFKSNMSSGTNTEITISNPIIETVTPSYSLEFNPTPSNNTFTIPKGNSISISSVKYNGELKTCSNKTSTIKDANNSTSNSKGEKYSFTNLTPGNYTIKFNLGNDCDNKEFEYSLIVN